MHLMALFKGFHKAKIYVHIELNLHHKNFMSRECTWK